MPSRSRPSRPSSRRHHHPRAKEDPMQRNLRNLAVALVAGSLALAAGAQDKAEKAGKSKAAAPAAASSGSGRVVVNGVSIPQSRFEAMNKELTAQGQPDTAERK